MDSRNLIRRRSARVLMAAVATSAVVSLAACAPPGSSSGTSTPTSAAVSTELTSEDITLSFYLESNFVGQMQPLMDEFTKQHPNVTFSVQSDDFTNLMQNAMKIIASPGAPDLVRFPTVQAAAKNGILTNLQPYAEAYGWDEWPEGLLNQVKVDADGNRGSGDLYSLGVGYSVTGVYYNKKLAEQAGITSAPTTPEEFKKDLALAKAAGITPISAWGQAGGVAFPLQAVQMNEFGQTDELTSWLYQQPDATYDTDAAVSAAAEIQDWADKGYFPDDVNALDYTTGMARFVNGESLFVFNGDWESTSLASKMGDDVGFFLYPSTTSTHYAMQAPATFVIPKTAAHADATAYFLNWVHTDETARQLVVEATGQNPGGPADLPQPEATSELQAQTLAASAQAASENGSVDFVANATAGIMASAFIPNLQLLVTDRMTPEEFATSVQEAYTTELGR
ncbi:ABC transporter substrate-binding protein [Microbacterium sp.]|uniref:ABC transporter substrate-binding protein n=1 Tax=Microbacterium sp. TaxID=51671 RepID=UPI0039E6FE66